MAATAQAGKAAQEFDSAGGPYCIIKNRRIMTQLQQFLFELSFGQTRRIREYMLKRYNVYCGSMKDLEQAINDYIPNEDILEELSEVLA